MRDSDKPPSPVTLTVDLGQRSYPIVIGKDLIDKADQFVAPVLQTGHVFIVTDDNVGPIYAKRLQTALKRKNITSIVYTVKAGEKAKSFENIEKLTAFLLQNGCERKSTIIALGGGVVGDLTGFAAAITLRGINFIQIPTSLLAQVDSSVGGKTGINTPFGKNLVGAFYQPKLVLADISTLETLPERELKAGYAEVAKYGLINKPDFWNWLQNNAPILLSATDKNRFAARSHAVETSCKAKAEIVAQDEREGGVRALLNLGHTFGHALEAETGMGEKLVHGEAVSIGMVMAFDLSARMGFCSASDRVNIARHLNACGLPVSGAQAGLNQTQDTIQKLVAHMAHDKKVDKGKVTFVLAKGIGKSFLHKDVGTSELEQAISSGLTNDISLLEKDILQ